MRVEKHRVVSFDYVLKDDSGEVLDTSGEGQPLEYVHGIGSIIPGLEKALAGRSQGDRFQVVVPAAEGYGEREDALVQEVARDQFEMEGELEVGLQFLAETEVGEHPFTVVAIEGDTVTVDGNHPLAGVNLHFEIVVSEVREASAEEIEHGHPHGEGCDHDHGCGHDHGDEHGHDHGHDHGDGGCCGGGSCGS